MKCDPVTIPETTAEHISAPGLQFVLPGLFSRVTWAILGYTWTILACYLSYSRVVPGIFSSVTWNILACYLGYSLVLPGLFSRVTWAILVCYLSYSRVLSGLFSRVTWTILACYLGYSRVLLTDRLMLINLQTKHPGNIGGLIKEAVNKNRYHGGRQPLDFPQRL